MRARLGYWLAWYVAVRIYAAADWIAGADTLAPRDEHKVAA